MSSLQFEPACRYLGRRDPAMKQLISRVGPCRLKRTRSYFVALFESIVWQQISWQAACAIHGRLLQVIGTRYPRPASFLAASKAELSAAGLSRRKVEYVRELSRYFVSRRFPRHRIRTLGDEEIVAELTRVRGIGRWSAEMFLIFGMNRPDVFPAGDLGVRNAIGRYYAGRAASRTLEEITELWRPYRTIATWYLWAGMDGLPESLARRAK